MMRKVLKPCYSIVKGFLIRVCLLFMTGVALLSCHHFGNNTNTLDVMSEQNEAKTVRIDSALDNFNNLFAGSTAYAFYRTNRFSAVWSKNKSRTILADSMIHIIRSARTYGLLPQDYHLKELDELIKNQHTYPDEFYFPKLDLLLTDAFFTITSHLKTGRVSPDSMVRYRSSPLSDTLQIPLLETALSKNTITDILESQEPSYKKYCQLRYTLRTLLSSSDSLERSELMAGNRIDPSELSSKIVSLEVNMERWKWESQLKGRYISVNIPSFLLDVVEDDSVVLESKVIVGTKKNQTPELDGLVRSFTIFPYWNVTRNIAVKEILPNLKKDSLYLASHHYEVLDINGNVLADSLINWAMYSENNFPFMLRQREGSHNSLGLIKFTFNNPYAVYLHDTNARLLFNREKRALSHGCIRVEKALELGRYLVKDNDLISPEDLDQYLELRKQMVVKVINPIGVHLRYFTCETRNGEVQFYRDIYDLDGKLAARIYPADLML